MHQIPWGLYFTLVMHQIFNLNYGVNLPINYWSALNLHLIGFKLMKVLNQVDLD